MSYRVAYLVLFLLFGIANTAYLHRVPGLMGDEASEGENVYELGSANNLVVRGERSYIGPLMDYIRLPFIQIFGYSTLALRLPMLLVSLLTFWLAARAFSTLFGRYESLIAASLVFFSPAYLAYQRLGWAITLLPVCALLLINLALARHPHKALFLGLVAGLALHNHILFLPTLAALTMAGAIVIFAAPRPRFIHRLAHLASYWPAAIGALAGFSTQLAVLLLYPDDQGSPAAMLELLPERLMLVPELVRLVVSGSAYIARYNGYFLSDGISTLIASLIMLAAGLGLIFSPSRRALWLWSAALCLQVTLTLTLIPQFSLRYFQVFMLGVWTAAAVGLAAVIRLVLFRWPAALLAAPIALASVLLLFNYAHVLRPFLAAGGSTNEFQLVDFQENAYSFVDPEPLIACVRGAGPVYSGSPHLQNILRFASHRVTGIEILADEDESHARWLIHYRTPALDISLPERCPGLRHFAVVPNTGTGNRQK